MLVFSAFFVFAVCHRTGCKSNENATAFNAIAENIIIVPWTPYTDNSIVTTKGSKIGPSAVNVQENPVAILLFSLKYVFKANELAEVDKPQPAPRMLQ